nr:16S rRNA (uracil(1498)-N(3))-methyltransferase [Desulfobulbaceae bacterium]
MNILLIHKAEIVNDRIIITGDKLKHLRKILKVQIGDTVKIGIINEKIGSGTVEALSKEGALLHVQVEKPPPERLPVHLILAIPRPIMLKRVLAQAASMGIEQISLLRSKRVEKSFLDSSIIEQDNYTPFLLKGIEQSVDTRTPEVQIHRRFKSFIEQIAADSSSRNLRLIAHPHGTAYLRDTKTEGPEQRIDIAIGPEGGWIDYEVEQFTNLGFIPFTMGARILRVDTAVPAILSQLELLRQQSHFKNS